MITCDYTCDPLSDVTDLRDGTQKAENHDDDETTSTNDITPMDIKKRHHGVRLPFFRSAIYTMFTVDH